MYSPLSLALRIADRAQPPDISFVQGDNVQVLPSLSRSFDLQTIDPPTLESTTQRGREAEWDKPWKPERWTAVARTCKQTLKPTGSVVVTPGHVQGDGSQKVRNAAETAFKQEGFKMSVLRWEKVGLKGNQSMSRRNKQLPKYDMEELLVFRLQTETSFKRINKEKGQASSIIKVPKHEKQHAGIHHYKPPELYEELYKMFVPKGGSVCELTANTFIGALPACKRELHFTGIELRADYLQLARKRLRCM
jgi:DNA modification methylase